MAKTNTQADRQDKGKGIATSSKRETKKKASTQTTKARAPKQGDLHAKLMEMKFEQTKFVDFRMLASLGIEEDVRLLFANMGVEKFMSMRETAHQGLTCDFLSSLKVRFFDEDDKEFEEHGRGYLRFTISKKEFSFTFNEICEVFGFPEEATSNDHRFRYPVGEHQRIWHTIASGGFEPGASKVALIRNPAIRYAYKALMHVFYAKVEVDTMTTEGLELVGTGLYPLLRDLRDGYAYDGPEKVPCLATLLARHLVDYKEWAWKTKAKKAYIGIGWIATAMVRAKAREVHLNELELPLMDETYLHKARFIKRQENGFAYSFHPHSTAMAKVLLPNPLLTRLESLENAIFNPPEEYHIGHIQEEFPEPTYGIDRYHFEPYTGPMNTATACSNAHERINLLQKTVKWQQRQMNKMAKTIKSLKRTIRDMACMRSEGSEPTRMEMSGEESSHRASRKGKGKRRAPTPSPSTSNESIDLETESSTPPSPTQSQ